MDSVQKKRRRNSQISSRKRQIRNSSQKTSTDILISSLNLRLQIHRQPFENPHIFSSESSDLECSTRSGVRFSTFLNLPECAVFV